MSVQWEEDYGAGWELRRQELKREIPSVKQVRVAIALALWFAGMVGLICLVNYFLPVGAR